MSNVSLGFYLLLCASMGRGKSLLSAILGLQEAGVLPWGGGSDISGDMLTFVLLPMSFPHSCLPRWGWEWGGPGSTPAVESFKKKVHQLTAMSRVGKMQVSLDVTWCGKRQEFPGVPHPSVHRLKQETSSRCGSSGRAPA
jgi:hypothetical protein